MLVGPVAKLREPFNFLAAVRPPFVFSVAFQSMDSPRRSSNWFKNLKYHGKYIVLALFQVSVSRLEPASLS